MDETQPGGMEPRAGFGADLPMRAWIFAGIIGSIDSAVTLYLVHRLFNGAGLTWSTGMATVLAMGLIAFTFGAIREGFRLERALIKARLEVVIGKLGE